MKIWRGNEREKKSITDRKDKFYDKEETNNDKTEKKKKGEKN